MIDIHAIVQYESGKGSYPATALGRNVTIRPFAIVCTGSHIGDDVHIGQGAMVRELNQIGREASIGSYSVLQPRNVIGDRSRIHTGVILENARIGRDVFIGPYTVAPSDQHPPCPKYIECGQGVIIEDRVKVGAHCILLPGTRIGAGSVIGAGSLVSGIVAPGIVIAGNPAKIRGNVKDLKCSAGLFGRPYEWEDEPLDQHR